MEPVMRSSDYSTKKQERERERDKDRQNVRSGKIKRLLKHLSIWIAILLLVWYGISLISKRVTPQSEDLSKSYEIQGRDHIANGATHPDFNSNPPSSGWHYASPIRTDFYDEPIPDETIVHNLEHGDIWIAYNPQLGSEEKEILKKFAGPYVVVSPRKENEGDISMVAWGKVDTFNIENGVIDEARIRDFILRYDNKGPEKVRSTSGVKMGL